MKKLSKLLSLALVIAMVFAMAVSASAVTITITGDSTGAGYTAYKILNLTTDLTCTNADQGHTHDDDCYGFAYTVNSKYEDAIIDAIKVLEDPDYEDANFDTDAEIVDYISKLSAANLRIFADEVYASIVADQSITAGEATSASNVITVAEQGYYLIEETTVSGSKSLIILDTAGQVNVTVATKGDVPTVVKKVLEDEDSSSIGYNDVADYDIGDDVSFQITGTLADKYSSYNSYKYIFHDTMDAGLTFNKSSVVVTAGGVTVNPSSYTVVTEGLSDGCTFEVRFADLKTIVDTTNQLITLTADSKIVVTYTAKLNENAEIGVTGNENKVVLEFSNNPYYNGNGEDEPTEKTPEDVVVVFTFAIDVSKTDQSDNPLTGATFLLYEDAACEIPIKVTAVVVQNGETGDDEISHYYVNPIATANEGKGDYIVVGTNVVIKGLEADEAGTTYYLKEITAPEGYNLLADPIVIVLKGTYALRDAYAGVPADALTGLTMTVDGDPATASVTVDLNGSNGSLSVKNSTGTELPTTGGVGRAIFTVVGVSIMAGALIIFIVSKRRKNYTV